jgi:hypothetical protein
MTLDRAESIALILMVAATIALWIMTGAVFGN